MIVKGDGELLNLQGGLNWWASWHRRISLVSVKEDTKSCTFPSHFLIEYFLMHDRLLGHSCILAFVGVAGVNWWIRSTQEQIEIPKKPEKQNEAQ